MRACGHWVSVHVMYGPRCLWVKKDANSSHQRKRQPDDTVAKVGPLDALAERLRLQPVRHHGQQHAGEDDGDAAHKVVRLDGAAEQAVVVDGVWRDGW